MKFKFKITKRQIEHAMRTQDCAVYVALKKEMPPCYVSINFDNIHVNHLTYKCDDAIREWQKHLLIASGKHTQCPPPKPITVVLDTDKMTSTIKEMDNV